ncbi:MAG: transketolase [Parvularcula sp.]
MTTAPQRREMANAIRALTMDAVQKANSGHPGMPMGMADVATVLFTEFLRFDAADPHWPDRDRFILSAGHGSMLIYALLYLTGNSDIAIEDIKNFRQLGAKTAGHPEYGHIEGIETTTGPLGQGIANAVGMAIAERLLNARGGDEKANHFTYAIAGDGCLMEGISHEAIDLAGHLGLGKLIVLWDDNSITIDGDTDVSTSTNQKKRFEAAGWDVQEIDGHDPAQISEAISKAQASPKPSLIACKTTIGFGAPNKQGTAQTHGAPLGDEEIAAARKFLDWPHGPFEIPDEILGAWREAGKRGAAAHAEWKARNSSDDDLLKGLDDAMATLKASLAKEMPKLATRKASQVALNTLVPALPAMIGGSADLTGSNLTKASDQKSVTPSDFAGSYLHYGVREHGMAAAMNGIALHGEFIPYGGTFLVFADYCRPSIRMSALMKQRVIYVMTHDSIGLGEDGPTHQPVEHLASYRAMPNVDVMRPADAMETAEAWECALRNDSGPTILALSRQGVPALRSDADTGNKVEKGAYVIFESNLPRAITILSSGTEVSLAVDAAKQLEAEGIGAAVVSMPSWERFAAQDAGYQTSVLGDTPRIAVEAATSFGWDRWLDREDVFVGVDSFGASGPGNDVYKHFGIMAERVVEEAKRLAAKIGA